MGTIYNSQLISELYSKSDKQSLIEIIHEMQEIGDIIFLRPIFDAYIKYNSTPISHYFISPILSFRDKNEVLKIALKILGEFDKIKHKREIGDLFEIFIELSYKDALVDEIGVQLMNLCSINEASWYDVDSVVDYFKQNKDLITIQNQLYRIFQDNSFDLDIRISAFNNWLQSDINSNLDSLLSIDLSNIGNKIDIIIASAIIGWSGNKIEKLIEKLKNEGGDKTKEIIERSREKKEAQQKKEEKKKKENKENTLLQSNVFLIKDIAELRSELNVLLNSRYGIDKLFKDSDLLVLAIFSPDISNFNATCLRLRDIFENIKNLKDEHNLDIETIKDFLPSGESTHNKPINALYLFLKSKKLDIPQDMYGFRDIHTLSAIIGSHENIEQNKIIKYLKKIGWEDYYLDRDYSRLNSLFLEKYREFLLKFLALIKSGEEK